MIRGTEPLNLSGRITGVVSVYLKSIFNTAMCDRYVKKYTVERGEVKWFYYHFRGERVERQIVLDLLNGFAILLTLENPVVGEYHIYEGDFSSVHWFEDFFMSKEDFEQAWERWPSLVKQQDRYIKESFFVESEQCAIVNFVHYEGEYPIREVTMHNGNIRRFAADNPDSDLRGMVDQPFSIVGYEPRHFISKDEFDRAWHFMEDGDIIRKRHE